MVPLLLALSALPVAAQTSDPDAATVRIGPVGITPSLRLRDVGRDENVFNEHENPKSDFTLTVVPRAEVTVHPRGVRLSFTTGTEYVYYRTYASERSTNNSASLRADFELARFTPYLLVSGATTSERLNSEVDVRERHNQRLYGGGLAVKVGTRVTLGSSLQTTRLRYDEGATFRGEDLSRSFDSDIDSVDGSASVQLTPFTRLTMTVSREQQRFTQAVERDADSIRVTPTFAFSADAVLNGSVSIGYRRFLGKSSVLPQYSGVVSTVNVGTTLFSRHRVEAIFNRDLRYSYERLTPYYLTTGGTATVTTELVGPFDLRLSGSRQLLAYHGLTVLPDEQPGDDTVTGYSAGLWYRLREHLKIGITADRSSRDSDFSREREYRNRRIFASMTWGAQ